MRRRHFLGLLGGGAASAAIAPASVALTALGVTPRAYVPPALMTVGILTFAFPVHRPYRTPIRLEGESLGGVQGSVFHL